MYKGGGYRRHPSCHQHHRPPPLTGRRFLVPGSLVGAIWVAADAATPQPAAPPTATPNGVAKYFKLVKRY